MDKENIQNEELSLEEKIMKMAEEDDAAEEKAESNEVVEPKEEVEKKEEEKVEEPEVKAEENVEEEPKEEEPKEEDAAEEVYTPNLKYKVYDKEYEFDEKVASMIKSKEDEDFFRDLYTKAAGVDVIKPKLEKYREEANTLKASYEETQTKYEELDTQLTYLNDLVAKGQAGDTTSINNLLDIINIPDKTLGLILAERLEMPEEYKNARRAASQAEYEKTLLEQQKNQYADQFSELEARQAEMQLDLILNNPSEEIKPIIEHIDSQFGAGSFKDAVIEAGAAAEQYAVENDKDLPTYEQVVNQVAENFRKLIGNTVAPSPEPTAPVEEAPKPAANVKKVVKVNNNNTIPNVGSSSGESPTGRAIKSLDDILAERNEHFGVKID